MPIYSFDQICKEPKENLDDQAKILVDFYLEIISNIILNQQG